MFQTIGVGELARTDLMVVFFLLIHLFFFFSSFFLGGGGGVGCGGGGILNDVMHLSDECTVKVRQKQYLS